MVRLNPVTLLWVVHFHQPMGNFQEVFQRYTDRVCRPFLAALTQHPDVRLTLHFSGVLLSYFQKQQPDLLAQIQELVRRKQVEILGGGFYEPIWSMIPRSDAERQLNLMADWVRHEFGVTPRGAWLPESVWEPHYVELLEKSGYAYTVLDESLFIAAGWKKAQLFHPFQTQYLNHRTILFPAHHQWSRQIPRQSMRDVKAAFTQLSHRAERQMIILAQDGDQYGLAPGTYEALHEQNGLTDWLHYLAAEQRWITSSTLDEARAGRWPNTYLPSGSEHDLESYAMPTQAQRTFLEAQADLQRRFDADRFLGYFHGGSWLGYLAKYAEAHLMQKKLVWLHGQIEKLPSGRDREEAHEKILAAEDHSAFWHARSAGVYANYLRDAVYQQLIAAEKILYAAQDESEPKLVQADYNGDGDDEVLLRTDNFGIVVTPNYGGSLCECNFWPANYNLANTFRRRLEAYHSAPADPALMEDWHERRMFQDHFVPPQTTLSHFQRGDFVELGDFIDQPFEIVHVAYGPDTASVTLERLGGLYFAKERRALSCRKSFTLTAPDRLAITYSIFNAGTLPTDVLFLSEINYTCLDGTAADRRVLWHGGETRCGESFEAKHQVEWEISDATRNLSWQWSAHSPVDLWHYPIRTVTLAGDQREENYQGSALLLSWPLQIDPSRTIEFTLSCTLQKISD